MKLNLDSTRRGPSGRFVLRLPHAPSPSPPPSPASPSRPASTPAAPAAPPPRPDVLDVLRNAPRRRATRQQIEALARKWGRK